MSARDLAARITLNSTGYETAIARVDAKASAFADKVEHKLSKKIGKYFGAGFVTGILISPLHKLAEAFTTAPVERASKLQEEADKLHITAEAYQLIEAAAKASGKTVEEWVSYVKESKTPLDTVISQLEQFRGQVELTDEEVAMLAANDFWKGIEKWWTPILAKGLKNAHDTMTQLMVWLGGGMTGEQAFQAVEESNRQDRLNAQSESRVGIRNLLMGKSRSRQEGAVNELQKIGGYVGGYVGGWERDISSIAKDSERTAKATEKLASKSGTGGPGPESQVAGSPNWNLYDAWR